MTTPLEAARTAIAIEATAVASLAARIDQTFAQAVEAIAACSGRLILTGMGKSGLVARKAAATFNSTGLSSFFLHPIEAMHGDIGLMRPGDLLIVVSKSGRLTDLEAVIAAAHRLGLTIISLAGNPNSPLAERSTILLDCSVPEEAGPDNLVPTASSTAALVMADALAVALLVARDFTPDQFAALHPAGTLGTRLLRHVHELHHTGGALPLVAPTASVSDLLLVMTGKRLGCAVVTDESGRLTGIFTDGDLRRLIESDHAPFGRCVADVMVRAPKSVAVNALIDDALAIMERHAITQLPTVDPDHRLVGVIHLHDILRSKLV